MIFKIRTALGPLSHAAPSLAARVAERLWFTPPAHRSSRRTRAILNQGRRFQILWKGVRVSCWQWGQGPTVHFMHGWGGNAGDLSGLVFPLVQRGFGVVSFDAPSHGQSTRGLSGWRQGNLFEFAGALRAVVDATAPSGGIVAHSGGVVAAAVALRGGLQTERAAFLASMADPEAFLDGFAGALGLTERAASALRQRIGRRIGFRWNELSVPAASTAIAVPPTLLVHDESDAEAPLEGAAAIARTWPGSELVTTRGLGHRRLLKDPTTLNRVADFLYGSRPLLETE